MSLFQPNPWVFRCLYILSIDGAENHLRFNFSNLKFFGKVPGRFPEVKPEFKDWGELKDFGEFKPSLSAVPMGFQVFPHILLYGTESNTSLLNASSNN